VTGGRETVALSAEDRAILALESGHVAGHTAKVVRLRGPLDVDALRRSVDARLGCAPRLAWRLGGAAESPVWERVDPDLGHHVKDGGRVAQAQVAERVGALFAERLPRDRPLWRMDLLHAGEGSVIVWRVHHALADGTAVMRFASQVLWDEQGAPPRGDGAAAGPAPRGPGDERRGGRAAFVLREFSRSARRNPFDARPGPGRSVALASVPLRPLHDAAKALAGATLNDAVLVCVAGGVRRWLEGHHEPGRPLRIKVPVSLHGSHDELGNRDSFFVVAVPLGEPDPARRLAEVHAETRLRKERHDAEAMDALLQGLARHSPGLERLTERIERSGRAFGLNVSNVRGPSAAVEVLGLAVASVHSLAEVAEHHALRVAVVSVAGALQFGLVADPAVVDGVEVIARGIESEAEALSAAAPG
jgi:hypothetical protein